MILMTSVEFLKTDVVKSTILYFTIMFLSGCGNNGAFENNASFVNIRNANNLARPESRKQQPEFSFSLASSQQGIMIENRGNFPTPNFQVALIGGELLTYDILGIFTDPQCKEKPVGSMVISSPEVKNYMIPSMTESVANQENIYYLGIKKIDTGKDECLSQTHLIRYVWDTTPPESVKLIGLADGSFIPVTGHKIEYQCKELDGSFYIHRIDNGTKLTFPCTSMETKLFSLEFPDKSAGDTVEIRVVSMDDLGNESPPSMMKLNMVPIYELEIAPITVVDTSQLDPQKDLNVTLNVIKNKTNIEKFSLSFEQKVCEELTSEMVYVYAETEKVNLDLSTLVDGIHTLWARVEQKNQHIICQRKSFTIDRQSPLGNAIGFNAINKDEIQVNFFSSDAHKVYYGKDCDTLKNELEINTNVSTVMTLPLGIFSISAKFEDLTGNQSDCISKTFDNQVPTVISITDNATDGKINYNIAQITITTDNDVTEMFIGVNTGGCNGSQWNLFQSVNAVILREGLNTIYINLKDGNGNTLQNCFLHTIEYIKPSFDFANLTNQEVIQFNALNLTGDLDSIKVSTIACYDNGAAVYNAENGYQIPQNTSKTLFIWKENNLLGTKSECSEVSVTNDKQAPNIDLDADLLSNNGSITSSSQVSFTLSNVPSDLKYYKISALPDCSDVTWFDYTSPVLEYTLPSLDQEADPNVQAANPIYMQFKDEIGNETSCESKTGVLIIYHDTLAPNATFNMASSYEKDGSVTLTINHDGSAKDVKIIPSINDCSDYSDSDGFLVLPSQSSPFILDVSNCPNTKITWQIFLRDEAENVQATASLVSVTSDTIDPLAITPNNPISISPSTNVVFSWPNNIYDTNPKEYHFKACTDTLCSANCTTEQFTTNTSISVGPLNNETNYYACLQTEDLSGRISSYQNSATPTLVRYDHDIGGSLHFFNDTGNTIQISLNGIETITLYDPNHASYSSNFLFSSKLQKGDSYTVTITSQPTNQNCWLKNGSGTVGDNHISDIEVVCNLIETRFTSVNFETDSNSYVAMGGVAPITINLTKPAKVLVKANVPYTTSVGVNTFSQCWLGIKLDNSSGSSIVAESVVEDHYWPALFNLNAVTTLSLAAGSHTITMVARKGDNNTTPGQNVRFDAFGVKNELSVIVLDSLERFISDSYEKTSVTGNNVTLTAGLQEIGLNTISVNPTQTSHYVSYANIPFIRNNSWNALYIELDHGNTGNSNNYTYPDWGEDNRSPACGDNFNRPFYSSVMGYSTLDPNKTSEFRFKLNSGQGAELWDSVNPQSISNMEAGVFAFDSNTNIQKTLSNIDASYGDSGYVPIQGLSDITLTIPGSTKRKVLLDLSIPILDLLWISGTCGDGNASVIITVDGVTAAAGRQVSPNSCATYNHLKTSSIVELNPGTYTIAGRVAIDVVDNASCVRRQYVRGGMAATITALVLE